MNSSKNFHCQVVDRDHAMRRGMEDVHCGHLRRRSYMYLCAQEGTQFHITPIRARQPVSNLSSFNTSYLYVSRALTDRTQSQSNKHLWCQLM